MKIHLEDCSSLWEEYIQEATSNIVVFTPYFDWMLTNLFAEGEVPYENIFLVTQLDRIDDRSENLTRLDRILELVNLGVNVKIVDRLHAKVLIIDEENAFFGSQNFTNYSTESIEITTQVNRYVDKVEDFFNYFEELLEGARYVTVDELNEAAGSRRYVSSDDTEINIDAISEVDLDEWLLEIDDDD
jgi:hypothetical protein